METVGTPGNRLTGLLVVVVLGLAGSIAVWRTMLTLENEVATTAFMRDAEERRVAIEGKFAIALETLESLASLFRVVPHVTRAQFREFTVPILERHQPHVTAFGWNVRVSAAERAAFERAGRAAGDDDYQITERNDAGVMVRAGDRPEYVAVFYMEPLENNEEAFGYDTNSQGDRRKAFAESDATGKLTITAPIRLVQDAGEDTFGFLACVPIRSEGYVVGVFRARDIVQGALEDFRHAPIAIRLTDVADPQQRALFTRDRDDAAGEREYASQLTYGGRTWSLVMRPTEAYYADQRSMAPHFALLVGLIITALATAYLVVLSGRSARVTALVAERTVELTRANRGLAREITQRETVEAELTSHRDSLEDTVRARTQALTGALDQLREIEERQRLTLDAIADGVWDWNIATGACSYSAPWLAGLGYDPDEVPPRVEFWQQLVHPDDLAQARAELIPHFEGRTPRYEFKCRIRRKNGELIWTLSRGRVVARDVDGNPLRMVGTNTDITDRVRAEDEQRTIEERLQHAQKLESLGVLAGGIAHDFNNLLVAMVSGTDLALQATPAGAPARFPLERVKLAATRAAELTDQMLAYAGHNTLVRERVRVPELVEEMTQLLDASRSKKAELQVHVEADVPAIDGDPTQLRQVVMNLITNASDAIGDGAGTVTVRIGTVTVGSHDLAAMLLGDQLVPGDYVSLEVADTGAGMDDDTIAKIFDPFFTTKFQGRGLGLAAVLGIVRSHGGAIRVDSQPDKGTTFRVLLPCAAAAAPGAPAEPEEPDERREPGTVMIIDDEEFVRDIARRVLEGGGFRVLEAADGPAGIETFRAHADEIGLVVLDMTMPRMSGTETIRELQRIRPDVLVIFSSGYSETRVSGAVAEYGAAGFVKKPYRVQTFLEAVRKAIRGPRSRIGSATGPTAGSTAPQVRQAARRTDP